MELSNDHDESSSSLRFFAALVITPTSVSAVSSASPNSSAEHLSVGKWLCEKSVPG